MAYLHDHGIVHRDLKPGNIFCDEGVVKIGDYGLSKFISCSRRSGQTESVGTVHYMAPEIANGRYGKEIDIYALGIILYEMLTGRVPFEGESVGEVLMKHLTAEPDLSVLAEPYRDIVRGRWRRIPRCGSRPSTKWWRCCPVRSLPGAGSRRPASPTPCWRRRRRIVFRERRRRPAMVLPVNSLRTAPAAFAASAPHRRRASTTIEEPIWRAVRDTWHKFWQGWHGEGANALNPLAKALIDVRPGDGLHLLRRRDDRARHPRADLLRHLLPGLGVDHPAERRAEGGAQRRRSRRGGARRRRDRARRTR